jgi:hypothetical protein
MISSHLKMTIEPNYTLLVKGISVPACFEGVEGELKGNFILNLCTSWQLMVNLMSWSL